MFKINNDIAILCDRYNRCQRHCAECSTYNTLANVYYKGADWIITELDSEGCNDDAVTFALAVLELNADGYIEDDDE